MKSIVKYVFLALFIIILVLGFFASERQKRDIGKFLIPTISTTLDNKIETCTSQEYSKQADCIKLNMDLSFTEREKKCNLGYINSENKCLRATSKTKHLNWFNRKIVVDVNTEIISTNSQQDSYK